jgi:hypothetical protein
MDDSPCSDNGYTDYVTYLNTEGHFKNWYTGETCYLYYDWDLSFTNYCQN